MCLVTGIRKLSGGRSLILLEDGREFPLYQKEIEKFSVAKDRKLSEEALGEIYREVLPKRARERALYLLDRMDRTEYQLREKLKETHYPPEIIDDTVSYVKSCHYLDDLRYATGYLETHARTKSLFSMKQELLSKGISREVLQQAEDTVREDGDFPAEEDQILSLLEKRHYDPETADYKEQQRTYAYLARRGYSASTIRSAMRQAGDKNI